MKKILSAIFIVATIALAAPAIQFVSAQTVDLGVQDVGLLPSNPFYFLKEWSRGVKKFFTASQINKAKLELATVNEKAAEVEKLVEITPYNKAGLIAAFSNYNDAVSALTIRLNSFTDTVSNPDVANLVNDIITQALLHQKVFDQLVSKYSTDSQVLSAISASDDDCVNLLTVIVSKIDSPSDFRIRLEAAARQSNGPFRDVPAIEMSDRLIANFSDEARDQLFALRQDLLADWEGYLEGVQKSAPDTLGSSITALPGDPLRALSMIDGVREIAQNSDLKNTLNISRQVFLEAANAGDLINDKAVAGEISVVNSLIAEIESMPGSTKAAVKEALSRSQFNLNQAEKFNQDEQYESAYGEASSAHAAAITAWARLKASLFASLAINDSLKEYYDALASAAMNAGIDKDQNPEISELLGNIEKQLIGISKLIEGSAKAEVVADATRSVRISLTLADQMIADFINPPLPPLKPAVQAFSAADVIPESATVVISSTGFLPSVIVVKPGTKVTWFNKDLKPHWPASDPYPSQTDLPGFDAKSGLSQGETYSFVFNKVGRWGYHDHLNPELSAVVEVKE